MNKSRNLIILLILSLYCSSASAWITLAVAAASYIIQANTPKSDGGVSILLAISGNLKEINSGIQVVIEHLGELNEKLERVPQRNYEMIESQNVESIMHRLNRIQSAKKVDDPLFESEAYFRDVYLLFKKAEDAQDKILNDQFKYAFVFYVPMVYIAQSSAYSMQTEMLTGLSDNIIKSYRINRGYWKAALKDYLTYYEEQLSQNLEGSFSWALKEIESTSRYPVGNYPAVSNFRSIILYNIAHRKFDNIRGDVCYLNEVKRTTRFSDCVYDEPDDEDIGGLNCHSYDEYITFEILSSHYDVPVSDEKIPTYESKEVIYKNEGRIDEFKKIAEEYMNENCSDYSVDEGLGTIKQADKIIGEYVSHSLQYQLLIKINEMNSAVANTIYNEASVYFSQEELRPYAHLKKSSGEKK